MKPHEDPGADARPQPLRPTQVYPQRHATPPHPHPLPQPQPPAADRFVAAARGELASVGQRPLAEHPDAFARVHAGLQQALSDIDDA